MPSIITRKVGPVTFECPYYDELLMNNEIGRLPRDLAAHALWYYYGAILNALKNQKNNFVYEDETSHVFNVDKAQKVLQSISNWYGTPIHDMVKYWDAIEKQRIALGGDTNESLPPEFKFQFSMRN